MCDVRIDVQSKVEACKTCRQLFSDDGYVTDQASVGDSMSADSFSLASTNPDLKDNDQLIHELELELAQTKLALVESECKNQELLHQLNAAATEAPSSKSTWLKNALSSIKEVTNKAKESSSSPLGLLSSNLVAVSKDQVSSRRDN